MENTPRSVQLAEDIFLVESGDDKLVYSPWDKKAFRVTENGSIALKEHFTGRERRNEITDFLERNGIGKNKFNNELFSENFIPSNVTLSLTSACNLRCVYCYANAGEKVSNMSFELAKMSIDVAIENLQKEKMKILRVIFHGGGESLVVFPLVKKIVDYVNKVWQDEKAFLLITNGTLIDAKMANFFKMNNFKISISMDGPKEIQDRLRPKANGEGSYEDCIRGMTCLKKEGIKFGIRATITKENVKKIKEILDIAYIYGASLKVEPVTPTGRGEYSVEKLSPREFLEAYDEAKFYGTQIGVELRSSYDKGLSPIRNYCGGNGRMFCVLPNGMVSSCSRVTREEDLFSENFFIGNIGQKGLEAYEGRISSLRKLSVENFDECLNCFAKWYCAGGCHHTRLSNEMLMPQEHCTITKNLLWQKLITQIEELEQKEKK